MQINRALPLINDPLQQQQCVKWNPKPPGKSLFSPLLGDPFLGLAQRLVAIQWESLESSEVNSKWFFLGVNSLTWAWKLPMRFSLLNSHVFLKNVLLVFSMTELKKVQGRSSNQNCRPKMFPKVHKSRQTIKSDKTYYRIFFVSIEVKTLVLVYFLFICTAH